MASNNGVTPHGQRTYKVRLSRPKDWVFNPGVGMYGHRNGWWFDPKTWNFYDPQGDGWIDTNTAMKSPAGEAAMYGYAPAIRPTCSHRGEPVKVGRFSIMAGGTTFLLPEDVARANLIVPLEPRLPAAVGQRVSVLACPWPDFKPPPEGFENFLLDQLIPELEAGTSVLAYCIGSHGRTGTFLAALIAILEPEVDDPIAEVRKRHCKRAVETMEQAKFIFSLKGLELPRVYVDEFTTHHIAELFDSVVAYANSVRSTGIRP